MSGVGNSDMEGRLKIVRKRVTGFKKTEFHFVLHDNVISWHTRAGEPAADFLLLNEVASVSPDGPRGIVIYGGTKALVLLAPTTDDRDSWVDSIRKHLADLKKDDTAKGQGTSSPVQGHAQTQGQRRGGISIGARRQSSAVPTATVKATEIFRASPWDDASSGSGNPSDSGSDDEDDDEDDDDEDDDFLVALPAPPSKPAPRPTIQASIDDELPSAPKSLPPKPPCQAPQQFPVTSDDAVSTPPPTSAVKEATETQSDSTWLEDSMRQSAKVSDNRPTPFDEPETAKLRPTPFDEPEEPEAKPHEQQIKQQQQPTITDAAAEAQSHKEPPKEAFVVLPIPAVFLAEHKDRLPTEQSDDEEPRVQSQKQKEDKAAHQTKVPEPAEAKPPEEPRAAPVTPLKLGTPTAETEVAEKVTPDPVPANQRSTPQSVPIHSELEVSMMESVTMSYLAGSGLGISESAIIQPLVPTKPEAPASAPVPASAPAVQKAATEEVSHVLPPELMPHDGIVSISTPAQLATFVKCTCPAEVMGISLGGMLIDRDPATGKWSPNPSRGLLRYGMTKEDELRRLDDERKAAAERGNRSIENLIRDRMSMVDNIPVEVISLGPEVSVGYKEKGWFIVARPERTEPAPTAASRLFSSLPGTITKALSSAVSSFPKSLSEMLEPAPVASASSARSPSPASQPSSAESEHAQRMLAGIERAVGDVIGFLDRATSVEERKNRGNDDLFPDVSLLIRTRFCSALAELLADGFRSERLLLPPYHLWDWIESFGAAGGASSKNIASLSLKKCIGNMSALFPDDKNIRFRSFVCCGITSKQLAVWLELLTVESSRMGRFYSPRAALRNQVVVRQLVEIVMRLSQEEFLLSVNFESRSRMKK